MTPYSAAEHLAGLKDFQRNAVEHVIDRFYGAGHQTGSGRFLVADETGLGKSVIARGVVARTMEELAAQGRTSVTVLYICSNLDLARQNLSRLDITGGRIAPTSTRLAELARHPELLRQSHDVGGTRLNLVSFTPGTSFPERGGRRSGNARERALITVLLSRITGADDAEERASALLMQGDVTSVERFEQRIQWCRQELGEAGPDRLITESFARIAAESGALESFRSMRQEALGAESLSQEWPEASRRLDLIYALRADLSRAGAAAMTPDLVILDEFQRFRKLMAAPGSKDDSPAAELARSLFGQRDSKLLLLSATPYSPYTAAEDAEDHHQDFLTVVDFLAGHNQQKVQEVQDALAEFRRSLHSGDPSRPQQAAQSMRSSLLEVMSRSERPPLDEHQDLVDVVLPPIPVPEPQDFADWVVMRRMARHLDSHISSAYWKSVPHFSTFMSGYQIGRKVREKIEQNDAELQSMLARTTRITSEMVEAGEHIDLGSGYLRQLAAETVDAGWWRMLWLPPSMPYLKHGEVYRPLAEQTPTKHLIFSSLTAVPAAISTLLSYEANRRVSQALPGGDQPASYGERLAVREDPDGRPASMSVMTLFWPHPQLARAGDPRRHADAPISAGALVERVTAQLRQSRHGHVRPSGTPQPWHAFFSRPGTVPAGADPYQVRQQAGGRDVTRTEAFRRHTEAALSQPEDQAAWHEMLPRLAAFSPGSIAYRCLQRIAPALDEASIWHAAWDLSLELRAMFNREETARLLNAVMGRGTPREQILDYIADGDLEAVLDEYVFQLVTELGEPETAQALEQIVDRAAQGVAMRPVAQVGYDYTAGEEFSIRFDGVRFASRYGSGVQADSDQASHRQGEVRTSFNSPFAPFVLASTSAGQEGIDFHWWCHRVVHWNLPSNPVDFEQREGRVNRFAGHAVRRNIAQHHRRAAAEAEHRPWHAAFSAAAQNCQAHQRYGSFSPWWVYPGDARIQRVIYSHPHSAELSRYERLRETLTLYRLTLGQPRQEDLVALIRASGGEPGRLTTIDLSPPAR